MLFRSKTPRFNETGDIVGEDSCRACEWVNGSIGTKLVAMVSGNKPGMSLAKQTIVNTKQVGKYIDEELKARDGKPWTTDQWKAAGYSVTRFKQFMEASNYRLLPKPKPETVGKLWPEFTEWAKANPAHSNGQAASAKQYCGQCENGWILPTAPNQGARPCACQNR